MNSDERRDPYPDPNENPNPNQVQQSYAPPQTDFHSEVAEEVRVRQRLSISGFLSWIVVLGISGLIFATVFTVQIFQKEEVGGDATAMDLMQMQIQAKVQVGQAEMSAAQAPPVSPLLDTGPFEQRLCFSILLNETESSTRALEHLTETDEKVDKANLKLTQNQVRLRSTLETLFQNYESGNSDSSIVPKEDREFLKERLGYTGELALYPSDSPHAAERSAIASQGKTMMVVGIVMMLVGLLVGGTGFVLSLVLAVMFFTGKLQSKFTNHQTNHNIYIETFAIWIAIFFFSSLALQLLSLENNSLLMMLQPAIFFGSLLALCWPIIRGVPFAQMRKDIGWTFGNPIKEIISGAWVYVSTIPFLIPGLVAIVVILAIISGLTETSEFGRQASAGHPIQEDIMSGNFVVIGFVFLATCVAAPIVEETMFRGVLYRHLRDLTAGWKFWASIIFAGLLNSLIFASIHPQGIMGIPVLTTLAIGFTVARQWRDSLVGPMTMHAIHNFLITCVSLLIL